MTAEWGVISQELMKRGILVPTGVKEKLLTLDNPLEVLNQASKVGFERGMLSIDILRKMILEASPEGSIDVEKQPVSIGRTIAPIKEPEPVQIQYRNNRFSYYLHIFFPET